MKPLEDARLTEIEAAEKMWSRWLAFEDWMVGPRDPESMADGVPPEGSQRSRDR